MDEMSLEERMTWLETELDHTREFNDLLLSFLALKLQFPLEEFVAWRDGWLGRGPKEPAEFRRFLSVAAIGDRAAEKLAYLADAEAVPAASLSLPAILARFRER